MKEIDSITDEETDEGDIDSEYYSVEDEDGTLKCSCGNELIKLDEETYLNADDNGREFQADVQTFFLEEAASGAGDNHIIIVPTGPPI